MNAIIETYLNERLPLISDGENEDIKRFKGKFIDTMYLHSDGTYQATMDRIQNLKKEIDQCVLDARREQVIKANEKKPFVAHVITASICTAYLWFITATSISFQSKLYITFFALVLGGQSAPRHQQPGSSFDNKMQDMMDMCDVLIHLLRHE